MLRQNSNEVGATDEDKNGRDPLGNYSTIFTILLRLPSDEAEATDEDGSGPDPSKRYATILLFYYTATTTLQRCQRN